MSPWRRELLPAATVFILGITGLVQALSGLTEALRHLRTLFPHRSGARRHVTRR